MKYVENRKAIPSISTKSAISAKSRKKSGKQDLQPVRTVFEQDAKIILEWLFYKERKLDEKSWIKLQNNFLYSSLMSFVIFFLV